ncbi:hypothetical protein K2173_021382 [Erythroxylum novogranatense]|uniref:Uncharacterized protein n=1 Tax=Erythroxylum novogranatense TaxID=1862640 RepID=A0AAV8TX39_9ROSI|nr:hypothetical protein K2173_021382 [Erythroxylum novogranatense]
MGICSSCESAHVATAKLILQDGRLQEFCYPVKVSYVLQKNPTHFICKADEMEFDNFVSAVNEDEDLQPGQLYFTLPLSKLKHPLQAEEMAALAVKASSALMKGSCGGGDKCGCRRKAVSHLVFPDEKSGKSRRRVAAIGAGSLGNGGGSRGSGGGDRRKYTAMLSAIPE